MKRQRDCAQLRRPLLASAGPGLLLQLLEPQDRRGRREERVPEARQGPGASWPATAPAPATACSRACADRCGPIRLRRPGRCTRCQSPPASKNSRRAAQRPCPSLRQARIPARAYRLVRPVAPIPARRRKPAPALHRVRRAPPLIEALGLCSALLADEPCRSAPFGRPPASLSRPARGSAPWLGDSPARRTSYSPGWAVALITSLGTAAAGEGSRYPQALLERSRQAAPARRIVPWPGSWGTSSPPAAWPCRPTRGPRCGPHAASAWSMPSPRSCALVPPGSASTCSTPATVPRRAGTRPRADKTIERRLRTVRDMAVFLTGRGKVTGLPPARRCGGVPGRPARRPADPSAGAAALLRLGPGRQAGTHRPHPRAVGPPAPRLPGSHRPDRPPAAPVPPLDRRRAASTRTRP